MGIRQYEWVIALLGAVIYVFWTHREKPFVARAMIAGFSASTGWALAPELMERIGVREGTAIFIIAVGGYVILDLVTGLLADRALWSSILHRKFGGGSKN